MLAQTHGASILRIKGILNIEEIEKQPVVVHAVQHMFHPPAKIDAWPRMTVVRDWFLSLKI